MRVVRSRPIIREGGSAIVPQEKDAGKQKQEIAYSNFEIDKLLCKCAHLVIEAESVFSRLAGGEDEVALSLLFTIHDDLVPRSHNLVIDIEGTSCLDLSKTIDQFHVQSQIERGLLTAK
jgi:hypothetical protein